MKIIKIFQRLNHWTLSVSILLLFQVLVTNSALAEDFNVELAKQSYVKCVACHSLEEGKHGVGPSLHDLNNRKAGTVSGFKFSKALRTSGVLWNKDSMHAYLLNPQKNIPRNRMAFAGLKNDEERQALVCYLIGKNACE
jgi:cytochrome c2